MAYVVLAEDSVKYPVKSTFDNSVFVAYVVDALDIVK